MKNKRNGARNTLLFKAKKAKVLATTRAALEERPDPAGTDPVTSKSAGTGESVSLEKRWSRTPYDNDRQKRLSDRNNGLVAHNTLLSGNSPIEAPSCRCSGTRFLH